MDLTYVAKKKLTPSGFCPKCAVKKLIHKAQVSQTATKGYDNGAALTPPMGWSSWNLFANHISESMIKEIADAMKKSGLADCGYRYVNIDDCWEAAARGSNGKLECDPITFPSGIAKLAQYVNSLDLKLGIYSSNGSLTCQNYPASLGFEKTDAETFAEWGIEYFKYDFCHNVPIPSDAPRIFSLNVGKAGTGDLHILSATQATLSGNARVAHEAGDKSRPFISGLCSRNGTAVFSFVSPEEGEYVLTFVTKTGRNKPEFALVGVNGEKDYRIYFPPTNSIMDERRDQLTVCLKKGENTLTVSNPVGSTMDSAALQYKYMGEQLRIATKKVAEKNGTPEKPIVYSICEWGRNKPWKWGREAGNLWRTTPDIMAKWASVLALYEFNVRLWKYAAPGSWNDPDMLEVGVGSLTYEENKSHFTLWCMLAAPLILGNDVREFIKGDGTVDAENRIYKILTNKQLIAVNQDALGKQCRRIARKGLTDILIKPLENGDTALCLFNKSKGTASVTLEIKEIANHGYASLPVRDTYSATELWDGTTEENRTKLTASIPAHGVKVYRLSAGNN